MLKELLVSLVVLTPTGIPAETPEIYFTPTPQEHADTTGLTMVEGFVDSREPQYYDDEFFYHDYKVTEVEATFVPQTGYTYYTVWGIDDYGTDECLGDDIAPEDLEDWMVVGTEVRMRWMHDEPWYHSTDFTVIG